MMSKLLQVLLLGVLALTSQAAVGAPKPPGPPTIRKADKASEPKISALISPVARVGFWEHNYFEGEISNCDVYYYNRCYGANMHHLHEASSISYMNHDIKRGYTIAFFTGDNCNRYWFRYSDVMDYGDFIIWETLNGYNDIVRSYMILNWATSTTSGYTEAIPPQLADWDKCYIW